jgi:hypothetical protein
MQVEQLSEDPERPAEQSSDDKLKNMIKYIEKEAKSLSEENEASLKI